MKTYLVGGAVRDKLLGLPISDKDWVVVGQTPAAMESTGFVSVGKDFPVFLHPESHEEYALARTERKTGPGYHGFEFDTAVTVTLEEDLSRRDLTINAIAEDTDGKLIDPFNGQLDINNKVLRHVSVAFAEDPVRILRTAKFMARFASLGFSVAPETLELIRSMVASGEVDNLVAERVWKELEAALSANSPAAFFTTMQEANALERVIPELSELFKLSERSSSRSDNDIHSASYLLALKKVCPLSDKSHVRFAAMCAEFGPANAADLQNMCERLRAPTAHTDLAILCARFTELALTAKSLSATDTHTLLKSLDVSRRPERFNDFLLALQATPDPHKSGFPQVEHLQGCAQAMLSIDAGKIAKEQTDKAQIPVLIKQFEVAAITKFLG